MKTTILSILVLICLNSYAQDDLLDQLEDNAGINNEVEYIAYTFKSTRIINGHSIETMKARQLDFRVNHRFGSLDKGAYELWGLDNALINFSLEYGITNWLMLGLRRGTYQKAYDASLKFTLFRQSKGSRVFPVSISYFTDLSVNTLKDPTYKTNSNRLAYVHQLLVARKFNEEISLQIMPSFVHRNLVNFNQQSDIIALGIGGRYKFHRRLALTAEYYATNNKTIGYYSPMAVGFDIETGGHVFQVFVTNSTPMLEKGVLAETTGDIRKGGLYFGFNISRVFAF